MKSITSKEALQRLLELAKSKTPPLFSLKASFNLKPLPSAKFFSILLAGSAGDFLASPPGSFPLQLLKKKAIIAKKNRLFYWFLCFSC